ncbi:MAG: 4Fe-4S ferredoxin, partial [Rikenellaceae bacterium]|nr:4Fe-4S ferredoxin [Rikenellaceae bacterium]
MKKIFSTFLGFASVALAQAQNRFPKPDFESGYQYPDLEYAVPDETLWNVLDVTMLVALLVAATWAVMKKRKPMIWISLVSVLY